MALIVAVDAVVVFAPRERHIVRPGFGQHTVACGKLDALGLGEWPIRIPGVGVNPAFGVGNRHPGLTLVVLARQRVGGKAVVGQQILADAPIEVVAVGIARGADGEAGVMLDEREARQRIVAHPGEALLVGIGIRMERLRDLRRRHVQKREMRGIERAFERLRPVALLQFFRHEAVRLGHQAHFERRQCRQRVGRPHVGPYHLREFTRRIGRDACLGARFAVVRGAGRHVRHLDAIAFQIVFPAVVHAADGAFLVAPKEEVGAAMRALRRHQADAAVADAQGDQVFTHHLDADRRAVRFRQLARERHRQPEAAQETSHWRIRTGAREQFIVGCAEHDQTFPKTGPDDRTAPRPVRCRTLQAADHKTPEADTRLIRLLCPAVMSFHVRQSCPPVMSTPGTPNCREAFADKRRAATFGYSARAVKSSTGESPWVC